MSINFDRDAFWSAYHRVANADPMRANCPPADEAASMKESAIQELTTQFIEEIKEDKEEFFEAFYAGYESEMLFLVDIALKTIEGTKVFNRLPDRSLIYDVGTAFESIITRHAMVLATSYLEE